MTWVSTIYYRKTFLLWPQTIWMANHLNGWLMIWMKSPGNPVHSLYPSFRSLSLNHCPCHVFVFCWPTLKHIIIVIIIWVQLLLLLLLYNTPGSEGMETDLVQSSISSVCMCVCVSTPPCCQFDDYFHSKRVNYAIVLGKHFSKEKHTHQIAWNTTTKTRSFFIQILVKCIAPLNCPFLHQW